MQKKKAVQVRQEWGGKQCPHPTIAREYDLGKRTGDYVCTQCGATLSFRERAEILAARKE